MEYSLNYEYNEFRIRLFLSNDSGPIFMNEFINYLHWSENKLKNLDEILDNSINTLIDRCKTAVPDLKIDSHDKINTKLKAKEDITRMVIENNKKIESKIKKLDISIKDWYIKAYPSDEVAQTLSPEATFLDLNNLLNSNKGELVYELLGGDSDSVIRERCFEKLSELTDQSYKDIYNKWLSQDNKEREQEEEIEK